MAWISNFICRLKNIGNKILAQALIFVGVLWISVLSAKAAIPEAMVPAYSNAVIFYNQKKYSDAIATLTRLLAKDSTVTEFLELEALCYKGLSKNEEALRVYTQLIAMKDTPPYHYERGLLEYQAGDLQKARSDLEFAGKNGFNVIASNFFLGLIEYQNKNYKLAKARLNVVANGNIAELKPMANYYLGQTFLTVGDSSSAGAKLILARQQALLSLKAAAGNAGAQASARQTVKMIQESLAALDHHGWFGSVGLTTSYDSNVLSVPSSASLTNAAGGITGKDTIKETVQASLGYMTSALKEWQWVPSYHGSFNYNFNQDTETGEFATHDFSLYLNHNVFARLNWGFHVDALYIQQDQIGSDSTAGIGSYSLTVPMGPYLRYQLSSKWSLRGSFDYAPEKYYLDPTLAPYLARSGHDLAPRIDAFYTSGRPLWNPSYSLIGDINSTDGTEYNSKALTLEFTDLARVSDRWDVKGAVDLGMAEFTDRPLGNRYDHIVTLEMNGLYHFKAHWNFYADIQYIDNLSTVPEIYEYDRLIESVGVSYSF